MWVTRDKEGELIGMSPRKEEAINMAEKTYKREEYINGSSRCSVNNANYT